METLWDSIAVKRRHNLQILFNYTSVIPFKWQDKYMCFFCDKHFNENERNNLRKHSKFHGECFPDNFAVKELVKANINVKVDVSEINCDLCGTNLPDLESLIDHLATKHDLDYVTNIPNNLEQYRLKDLHCLVCDNRSKTFSQLESHIKKIHPKHYLICATCSQRFDSKDSMNYHWQNFHADGRFSCDLCVQTFTSELGLDYHRDLVHDSLCDICLQCFPTPRIKQKHMEAKHADTKLKCFACCKRFDSKTTLRIHTKRCYILKGTDVEFKHVDEDLTKNMRSNMHNILSKSTITPFKWYMNRYRCFYCTKDFTEPELLKEHTVTKHPSNLIKALRRCKGEQGEVKVDTTSVSCKVCSDDLNNLDELVDHLVSVHNVNYDKAAGTSFQEFKLDKNEILCPFCNEKFSFFGNVLKHINDKHFEKNFVCTYCGLYFCKEVNLRGHITNQHNVTGVQCSICGAKLSNKSKLIIHMANYHGSKLSKCSLCSESFTSAYVRAKHMVEKHNLEYKCTFCTKIFAKKYLLQKHMKKIHGEEVDLEASTSKIDISAVKKEPKIEEDINECDDLNIDLLSVLNSVAEGDVAELDNTPYVRQYTNVTRRKKINIQIVLNMSTVVPFKWFMNNFRCFFCSKNFKDPETLREHCTTEHSYYDMKKALKKCKGENITVKIDITGLSCRICSVSLTDMDALIDHLILKHDADYDKSIGECFIPFRLVKDNMVCLSCGEKFNFFGHLLMHINERHQSKDLICSYCGLGFSKFVNLRSHISNHHKQNSHNCTVCDLSFSTKNRLSTHMAKYHGAKVVKCRDCDESFTSSYMRNKHMVEKHDLEYKCNFCDKIFPKNSILKTHIRRVHLKERNVQCDVCHDRFFDNVLLRLHMVKHEGVRNFKCDYCGKAFLWLKNLRAHVKAHNKEIPMQNMC